MQSAIADRRIAVGAVRLASCFGIVLGLAPSPAAAQGGRACVALKERPLQAIGAIHLVLDGQPEWLASVAERAAAMWNDPGCNGAKGFPEVVLASTRIPHRRIRVRFEPGFNAAEPRSCGSFVGSDIVLYGRAIHPRTRELGGCGAPERIAETLAHEIGHALGLLDRFEAECYGSIMSQLVWVGESSVLPRAVQPYECAAADVAFETPFERRSGRQPVVRIAALPVASGGAATARSLLTLPELAAPLRPRSVRTAPGIPATGSDEFRP